jgi:hypothetical protein
MSKEPSRDDVLRRMLKTPSKPFTPEAKKKPNPEKPKRNRRPLPANEPPRRKACDCYVYHHCGINGHRHGRIGVANISLSRRSVRTAYEKPNPRAFLASGLAAIFSGHVLALVSAKPPSPGRTAKDVTS